MVRKGKFEKLTSHQTKIFYCNTSLYKYRYTITDIQVQIYNTDIQVQIYKYRYTSTDVLFKWSVLRKDTIAQYNKLVIYIHLFTFS